jgi:hypothetical protein
MTADITEVGLAELLQLPHVRMPVQTEQTEQVGPGRQGGPLLVVIGISLIGLALWGWAEDTLGWSVFALTALGAALTMTGVGLAAHTPREPPPVGRRPGTPGRAASNCADNGRFDHGSCGLHPG